jgi:hypothetical protein
MFTRTTSLVATVLRRAVSVAMCALMLLAATISTDVGASPVSTQSGQAQFMPVDGGSGGAPVPLEALPCHSAHHLCGKVTPLPPVLAAAVPPVVRPEFKPLPAPDRVLLSGVTELPPRPPRA